MLSDALIQDVREYGSNVERNRVGKQNQKRTVRHIGDHRRRGHGPAGMGSRDCRIRRSRNRLGLSSLEKLHQTPETSQRLNKGLTAFSGNNFIFPSWFYVALKQRAYAYFREQLYCSSTPAPFQGTTHSRRASGGYAALHHRLMSVAPPALRSLPAVSGFAVLHTLRGFGNDDKPGVSHSLLTSIPTNSLR
jgi:hypothetical protein